VPRPKSNRETEAIRRLIHQHLRRGAHKLAPLASRAHLDEDALTAFVEGRLGETESAPLISHLVACDFCRRITAQLIRLESETSTAGELAAHASTEAEPGRFRNFLADLASRVLPSTEDDAVFAYHAPAEDFQKNDEGREEAEVEVGGTENQLSQESGTEAQDRQDSSS
jgi:hypothetical protein